jgi:hypothetical protein
MNTPIDVRRIADIGAYPVTLEEAKEKCRVTFTDDDSEFTQIIRRATRFVENYCNISIVYQRVQFIGLLEQCQVLPYGPVIGIESVMDSQGVTGSGPVSYVTSTRAWGIDGDIFEPAGCNRVKVIYTAGMDAVPDDLKDVILQVIEFLYENRGADTTVADLIKILHNADHYKVMAWV